MQEMAEAGAKVLNSTAVDFARRSRIAIHARSTFQPGRETVVHDEAADRGSPAVVGRKDLALLRLEGAEGLARLLTIAGELGLSVGESTVDGTGARAVVARGGPDWARAEAGLREALPEAELDATIGAVALVARELGKAAALMRTALAVLDREGIAPRSVTTAPLSWSALVGIEQVDDAVRAVHRELVHPG